MTQKAAEENKVLFIDDDAVSSMEGVERHIHPGKKHEGNPLVVSDGRWEAPSLRLGTVLKEGERYRMWYQSRSAFPGANNLDSYTRHLHMYAESEDGVQWKKPALGLYRDMQGSIENNIAFVRLELERDLNPSVMHTPHLGEERSYTMITYGSGYDAPYDGYYVAFSRDGVSWANGPSTPVIPGYADTGWFSYDDADGTIHGTVRSEGNVRGRNATPLWTQSADASEWSLPTPTVIPDEEDDCRAAGDENRSTDFYGMPVIRYGPLLLGFLQVYLGQQPTGGGFDGEILVQLVSSRDGQTWNRVGDKSPLLQLGEEGTWDSGLVWSGNSFVTAGDELRLYYTGCEGSPRAFTSGSWPTSVGMASWPRDRMVGLAAGDRGEVVLKTSGGGWRLHINADAARGSISAEVLDKDGSAISGYDRDSGGPMKEDSLDHVFRWPGGDPLHVETGAGLSVRLIIHDAEVFSLWWE